MFEHFVGLALKGLKVNYAPGCDCHNELNVRSFNSVSFKKFLSKLFFKIINPCDIKASPRLKATVSFDRRQ